MSDSRRKVILTLSAVTLPTWVRVPAVKAAFPYFQVIESIMGNPHHPARVSAGCGSCGGKSGSTRSVSSGSGSLTVIMNDLKSRYAQESPEKKKQLPLLLGIDGVVVIYKDARGREIKETVTLDT